MESEIYFEEEVMRVSTFVIFFGSEVPVSRISTFWYTLGEFSHRVRSFDLRPFHLKEKSVTTDCITFFKI
jgi:hypothetical protein